MKILRVKARGFIGFKNGMGQDEIDVDLSGLAGLVGLAGENGRGKTTFLEVCSPFRTLASRRGKLNDHVYLRDSFKEVTFELGGDEYRCLVKIDSGSARSEGFVYKNDNPEVNGKVTEYDQYITDLIGSQNLFYSSVFCAQNSQKLSDMRPGEIKELFVEFLQIKKYEEWEKTSKMAGAYLAGMSNSTESEINRLRKNLDAISASSEEIITNLKNSLESNLDLFNSTDFSLSLLKDEREVLNKQHIENQIKESKRADIDRKIAEIQTNIDEISKNSELKRSDIDGKIRALNHEIRILENVLIHKSMIDEADSKLKSKLTELKECELSLTMLSGSENGIRGDIDRKKAEIDGLREKLQSVSENSMGDISKLKTKKSQLGNELHSLKSSNYPGVRTIQELNLSLNYHRKQLDSFAGIDPDCISTTCKFIHGANESKIKIPEILEELRSEQMKETAWYDSNNEQIKEKESQIEKSTQELISRESESSRLKTEISGEISDLNQAITNDNRSLAEIIHKTTQIKKQIETIKNECARLEELLKMRSEIEVAEGKVKMLKEKERELTMEQLEISSKLEKNTHELYKLIDVLKQDRAENALCPGIKEKLGYNSMEILNKENELNNLMKERVQIEERIKTEEGKTIEAEKIKADIEELEAKKKGIDTEISEWNYLQYACSKKGLQILEIDGVTPLIVRDANEILHSSFGGEFTLKIVTKDEETGAEVFQIWVIKNDGSEVLIENLSGGQKVWCLKALRLAMTLISKEKSHKSLQTAFADEEDGALDEEKAARFIRLYRAFMTEGGFDTCLFISHRPDVIAMADHRLQFTEAGIMAA